MAKQIARLIAMQTAAWVALTAATWLVVTAAFAAAGEHLQAWDDGAIAWVASHERETLTALSDAVTDLGKPSAAIPLTAFAVLAFFFGVQRQRDAAWILLSCVGAGASYLVLLPIFGRPRPDAVEVSGLAMPSGHAVATLALALPVAIAAWRAWNRRGLWIGVPALALAILVGVTRPYIQYHYPSDVIVAWALTAVWVFVLDRFALPPHERWPVSER